MEEVRICPKCHRPYKGRPAISRMHKNMNICPDCGMREALQVWKENMLGKEAEKNG